MKALLYGKNVKHLEKLVRSFDFEITQNAPDVVISYGGDGTLLSAERHYPGIPKLPLRDDSVCKKCDIHTNEQMLATLKVGKLTMKSYTKLEVKFNEETLVALNDIVIRNKLPMHAVRLGFTINGKGFQSHPIIGDGIVLATPFGSTGYFHSITRKTFTEGFAVAFNNPTEIIDPIFLSKDAIVQTIIVRGPATLSIDNSSTIFPLIENDTLVIRLSERTASIFAYETLGCPDCIVYRDLRLS